MPKRVTTMTNAATRFIAAVIGLIGMAISGFGHRLGYRSRRFCTPARSSIVLQQRHYPARSAIAVVRFINPCPSRAAALV